MGKKNLGITYPRVQDAADKDFSFVRNETLRQNLAFSLQYIIFLLGLEDGYLLGGPVRNTLNKNIVLFCAGVVESLLNYKLQASVDSGLIPKGDVFFQKEDTIFENTVHKCRVGNEDVEFIFARRKITRKGLDANWKFQDLIRACEKVFTHDEKLFEECKWMNSMRNRIHLAGLSVVDKKYSKKDVDRSLTLMSRVITWAK